MGAGGVGVGVSTGVSVGVGVGVGVSVGVGVGVGVGVSVGVGIGVEVGSKPTSSVPHALTRNERGMSIRMNDRLERILPATKTSLDQTISLDLTS